MKTIVRTLSNRQQPQYVVRAAPGHGIVVTQLEVFKAFRLRRDPAGVFDYSGLVPNERMEKFLVKNWLGLREASLVERNE
jgi:hypothetical protein